MLCCIIGGIIGENMKEPFLYNFTSFFTSLIPHTIYATKNPPIGKELNFSHIYL